jgi:hypothetical protein
MESAVKSAADIALADIHFWGEHLGTAWITQRCRRRHLPNWLNVSFGRTVGSHRFDLHDVVCGRRPAAGFDECA